MIPTEPPDGLGPEYDICECSHHRGAHRYNGVGSCAARDSYGQPCSCPSFVLDPNLDQMDEDSKRTLRDNTSVLDEINLDTELRRRP